MFLYFIRERVFTQGWTCIKKPKRCWQWGRGTGQEQNGSGVHSKIEYVRVCQRGELPVCKTVFGTVKVCLCFLGRNVGVDRGWKPIINIWLFVSWRQLRLFAHVDAVDKESRQRCSARFSHYSINQRDESHSLFSLKATFICQKLAFGCWGAARWDYCWRQGSYFFAIPQGTFFSFYFGWLKPTPLHLLLVLPCETESLTQEWQKTTCGWPNTARALWREARWRWTASEGFGPAGRLADSFLCGICASVSAFFWHRLLTILLNRLGLF